MEPVRALPVLEERRPDGVGDDRVVLRLRLDALAAHDAHSRVLLQPAVRFRYQHTAGKRTRTLLSEKTRTPASRSLR